LQQTLHVQEDKGIVCEVSHLGDEESEEIAHMRQIAIRQAHAMMEEGVESGKGFEVCEEEGRSAIGEESPDK
jgi:hypothetical protein